jgi:CubicO group peptidase (beta-lactamase class C family)
MIKHILSLLLISHLIIFQACAQVHQQNENWLHATQEAIENSVVLNNRNSIIPLGSIANENMVSLNFGFSYASAYDSLLNKYHHVKTINGKSFVEANQLNLLEKELSKYSLVFMQLSDAQVFNDQVLSFIDRVQNNQNLVVSFFGKGESLLRLDAVSSPIIWSRLFSKAAAEVNAQIIFGGMITCAKLDQDYSDKYLLGMGSNTQQTRLSYTVPEEIGINSNDLLEIDKIVAEAIKEKAAPGSVVLVAKNGKVIFNKAYGYNTYDNLKKNKVEDIYDLASITKIAATSMAAMKLYEEDKLNLESSLNNYLPVTENTDKAKIKVKDVLLHQAGFIPFIPFYTSITPEQFSTDSTENFSIKVADHYFMNKDYYHDVMWKQMLTIPLRTPGKYVYSDLSMYYMKEIIENISKETLPDFVNKNFYDKLGMYTTGFQPRNRFNKEKIIPTEEDSYFRKTLVWGYTHDQGAAMANGIAGHAGLFSNATDLATLFQMILNKGTYGGEEYLKPITIDLFTSKQSDVSRRGLGFDRWDPDSSKKYPSKYASSETFGHTGYTGTCVWVDPKEDLIYIFLSNRVYPKVNNKLLNLNIRSRIQDVIYQALKNDKQ